MSFSQKFIYKEMCGTVKNKEESKKRYHKIS